MLLRSMVSETRSGRQIRNELNDNKLKEKVKIGKDAQSSSSQKDDTSGVRKSGSETAFSDQTTPSPQSTPKPKRSEKETPHTTPCATRKSERLEKLSTPSPLKKLHRNKKKLSPGLQRKQSSEEFSFPEEKRQKEKNLLEVVMESAKAQVHSESVGKKKKRMNLRTYIGKYKIQRLHEIVSDIDGEFEESDTLSINATVTDNVVDEPPELPDGNAFGGSQASSNVKEIFNSSEGLPRNCSPTSVGSPISESSTCLERLQDDAVHSESGEKCAPPKAPVNTPHSSDPENNSLSRACTLCCKNKRISSDSPEKELCSCDATAIVDVGSSFIFKDRGDHVAAVIVESAGKCNSKNLSEKLHSEDQMPGHETVCTNRVEIPCGEEKTSRRCPRFIDGSTSRFLEWWLPVQLSNHQLEQYCATLLSNSIPLRSYSKIDPVGAIQKILPTVRKCCDHPYLDDLSEQGRLIAEGRPAAEILEIGIKASGKLQLLDMMLAEIKTRNLQVLILFQLILGSGKASAGDILDDFLRQRFGQHSYERIDSGITPSRKQAAVNRFNKKETDQFVLLLENRACSSTIKLLSLDTVIIYDSDWNPVNDFRALQRVSFDSKVEQIKVLRLYSTFTVEERSLLFAKQNINIENSLQTLSRGATSDNLLMWGASHLFSRLEEYHSENISALSNSSQQLLLTEVIQELQSILSESCGVTNTNSVVSTVKFDAGRYSVNTPLLGEAKVQLKEGEEAHVFWRNLLDRETPQWKHLSAPSPRNRKRVQYFDGSPSKPDSENDDVGKKRRRAVNENVDPASVQVELGEQAAQAAGPEGGFSNVITCDQYQSLQRGSIASEKNPNCKSNLGSIGTEVDALESEERVAFSKQKSLHSFLLGEMTRLCQILKLSEDATHTVKRFLEYVIKNHHVSSDSLVIMQAFQLSLCWVASSISKHKLDKKESLLLVKQLLNYQCTEEQAHSVYSKMRSLKRMYLQCAENVINSGREGLLGEGNTSKELSNKECGLHGTSYELQNVKKETEEKLVNEEHTEGRILLQMELARKDIGARSEIDNKIKQIEKKCSKRMKRLVRKQQEKIKVFHQIWEERRLKLEEDHKLESAFIRSLHGQGPVRMDKLKRLDDGFAKKLEEHNLLKDAQLKDLEAEHVAAKNEERQKATHWLTQPVAHFTGLRAANHPLPLDSQSEDFAGCSQSAIHAVIDSTDVISIPSQQIQDQNPNSNALARGNDMAPSNTSISDPSEPVVCDASVESQNNITSNCQNDTAITSPERSSYYAVEQLNQSKQSTNVLEQLNPLKQSCDTSEMACEKMPVSGERVSYEPHSVEPNKEVSVCVPETIPNKNIEFSNVPNNGCDKGDAESFTETVVGQRDWSDKITLSSLNSGGKILESSEKVVVSSDRSGLQVSQDKVQPSSMELQDKNVAVIQNQCIPQIVVAPLEPFSTLSNVELQDQDGPAVEDQGISQSANSELVDTVNPVQSILEQQVGVAPAVTQSNVELQDQDGQAVENQGISQSANSEFLDTVNPVQSITEQQVGDAPAVENRSTSLPEVPVLGLGNAVPTNTKESENCEQVDQMSVEEPPSCNMYPAVEDAHENSDQGRDSFPTAEVAATQMLSHESYSQSGENLEISSNPLDLRSNIPLDRSAELPVSSQNVAVSQAVADAVEVPNRTVVQLGIDTSPLLGSSYIAHPTHQGASWNLTPPLFTEPLQNELERIRKEKEHLEKNHEDMASKLKSDCEKEIQQIRNKYEMKLQDAETNLRLKKNVLEQNQNKVLMNKVLAEAFKSKCLNLRPSGLPGMQQAGMPPGFMQHLHQQLSLQQPSVRVPPGASNFQPSSTQQNASPAQIAAMHHIPLPHSTRASPVTVQNVIAPAGQRVLQAPAPFSGTPSTSNSASRPPLISSITPSRNPRVGGEIRSTPPHLQPFRPPAVSQQRPPQPIPPPPPHAPLVSASQSMSTSQIWVEPQIGVPSQRTTSLSAQGLLMEMDHRPRNRASSPLPEICSTFSTLEPSDLETLANVQGNHTSSSADVVCLSDDE